MALKSIQLVMSAVTAQAAIVQGSGSAQFKNAAGTLQDPLPVQITNLDPTITIWLGGSGVTAGSGTPILAGQSWVGNLYGTSEIPWLIAASGTPTAAVLLGRQ